MTTLHNHEIPEQFDDGPFDERSREPDETSAEDVAPELDEVDNELRKAGMLEPVSSPGAESDDEGPEDEDEIQSVSPRLERKWLEAQASNLRKVWGELGVTHIKALKPEVLDRLDPEILEQLDQDTAELVYFDTARKVWKGLGSEPVSLAIILAQLQPPEDPSRPAKALDLSRLRADERDSATMILSGYGLDPGEINRMVAGSPQDQQNAIRLAYLLEEEPNLGEVRALLLEREASRKKKAKKATDQLMDPSDETIEFDVPKPLTFSEAVDTVIQGLHKGLKLYEMTLRKTGETPDTRMDAIGHIQADRVISNAENSQKLAWKIKQGLGPKPPAQPETAF